MSNHSFNPLIAKKYGIIESVIINTFIFWIQTNAAKETNYFEDRYWCFGTPQYFTKFFSYLTARQIKYALHNLIKAGVLLKGNFNKKAYDKTNWYSLSDSILFELNLDKTCLQAAPALIGQNCPMDWTNLSNGSDKFVQPIPDNKPVNKQDINNIGVSNETLDSKKYNSKIFCENLENLTLSNCTNKFEEEKEIFNKIDNQALESFEAKEGLEETKSPDKSDYRKNQTKKNTHSTNLTQYGINNILQNNIFQIPEQLIQDWITNRKKKRAAVTQTAWNKINKELAKCKEKGIEPIEAFEKMVAHGWQGIDADWFYKDNKGFVSSQWDVDSVMRA